jgi:hypothetical protein
MNTNTIATNVDIGQSDLGKRLDEIGWALFLETIGENHSFPGHSLQDEISDRVKKMVRSISRR